MSVSFGLHVGQTSACLAVSRDGRVDVVANDAGDRCTSAVVAWNGDEVLVGESAAQFGARNPQLCVKYNGKLLAYVAGLTTSLQEAKDHIEGFHQSMVPSGPRILVAGDRVVYHIEGGNGQSTKKIPPSSVQTHIFRYMHDIAASHATAEVEAKNTVLTVPFGYSVKQRQAVVKSAQAAGFHVVQVISQPAAACLAYSLGQLDNTECLKCLVYQCGGNSLTVSVVDVNGGMMSVEACVQVEVGGDRITGVLADFLAAEFKRKHRLDPAESKRSVMKLRKEAQTIKHILSTLDTAQCHIESLCEGIDFSCSVTRARLDNELAKLLSLFVDPVHQTLAQAGIKAADIDKIVLCGGTTKIPKLKTSVCSLFPQAEVLNALSPDEILALGAASQASLLNEPWQDKETDELISPKLPATSHSIVVTTSLSQAEIVLIPDRCPIPTRRSHHVTLANQVDSLSVKLGIKSSNQLVHELGQLSLQELTPESKLSISAHIHRDGGVHFGLTDKQSGKSDQLTFQAPQA